MHIVDGCAFQHGDGLAEQVNGFLKGKSCVVVLADQAGIFVISVIGQRTIAVFGYPLTKPII